jgi:hypothetical protein
MSVRFETVAHVSMPPHRDHNWRGWATYSWNERDQLWKCQESNEGFHKMYNIKWEMTSKDMTALILKAAD